ncbi:DUF6491 family protein [Porticoccus sp. W117]|uniref:DUF6491 family protein n=1 Tax=Porticoccus sp. W117 TaxID=3054777 RepID=UPI0025940C4F|nr:DUF6491 family protein [Porticoccus sp. W117]MDM3870303.1 DUF6491 family protein [Porticoccus sp. W117]
MAEQEPLPDDYDLDPKKWGIHSGCINTNRIRSMNFVDDQSAILKISGKKYILMTLARPCRGVRRRGISYETRTGKLCERFDRITSLETGASCQIKSFEPYLLPEEAPEAIAND